MTTHLKVAVHRAAVADLASDERCLNRITDGNYSRQRRQSAPTTSSWLFTWYQIALALTSSMADVVKDASGDRK